MLNSDTICHIRGILAKKGLTKRRGTVTSRILHAKLKQLESFSKAPTGEGGDFAACKESSSKNEASKGPGGHIPDGTGPHGRGMGPGKGTGTKNKWKNEKVLAEQEFDRMLRLWESNPMDAHIAAQMLPGYTPSVFEDIMKTGCGGRKGRKDSIVRYDLMKNYGG